MALLITCKPWGNTTRDTEHHNNRIKTNKLRAAFPIQRAILPPNFTRICTSALFFLFETMTMHIIHTKQTPCDWQNMLRSYWVSSCMHDATPTAHNVMPLCLCLSPVAHKRALCTNNVNLPLWLCPITSFILQSRPTYTLTHTHMTAYCMHSHVHAHDRILHAYTHTHVHALASHALRHDCALHAHKTAYLACFDPSLVLPIMPTSGDAAN